MNHPEDDDDFAIVPDEVTEDDEVDEYILKTIKTDPSSQLETPLQTTIEEDEDEDSEEDYYSGPSKVIRLPLTVEPSGTLLVNRSVSQINAIQKTAEVSSPSYSTPPSSSPSSSSSTNFISEYFRQLHREICLLSPLLQFLLFLYLVALTYIALI